MVVDLVSPQRVGVMVASHNEDTVRFTLQQMQKNNIKPEDKVDNQRCLMNRWYLSQQVICFGQLLGMCDNLSFPLGERPISLKDCIVSPPFRPSGLQRVQVRSVRSRQRGAALPFQVPQTVQGSFCLIDHMFPRRAHENKGILEKLEKEKSLLKRELRDRVGILFI